MYCSPSVLVPTIWVTFSVAFAMAIQPQKFSSSPSGQLLTEQAFETLDEGAVPHERRDFVKTPHLFSYIWNQSSPDGVVGYNISVDVSGCGRSVHQSTIAGIYTPSNGITQDNAAVGDILADLKTLKQSASNLHDAERVIGNHTLTIARLVEGESNRLLDSGLIYPDALHQAAGGESIHDELCRLLWLSSEAQDRIRDFFFLIFGSSVAAGLAGGVVAGIAAGWQITREYDDLENANEGMPLGDDQLPADVLAGWKYIRNQAVIGGVTTFFATFAAGITSDIVNRGRMRATERFPARVYLAMARRAMRDYQAALARSTNQSSSRLSGSSLVWNLLCLM